MGGTDKRVGWLGKGLIVAMLAMTAFSVMPTQGFAENAPTTDTPAVSTGASADNSSSKSIENLAVNATLGAVLSPVAVLTWMIFKVASLLLGLVGVIFNWATIVVVFQFSEYLGNSPGMLLAWGILRDFGNIALIFGFVYMGIRTILDIGHFNTGKTLAGLVVAAILMNFSLFAAEAIIDTTNVLSASLYEQSYDSSSCIASEWLGCAVNNGIAGQILQKLEITSAFGEDGNIINGGLAYFSDPLPHILKFIGLTLFFVFAMFVLLAGAMMLISRGVVLAFLMVTSPIGFAGMAVPPLQKLSEQWWEKLIDQALFAPAFLLLLFVSLKMTDGLSRFAGSQGGLASSLFSTDVASTGTLIMFVLIIGFMIGSLMMASKFGIYGAEFATKMAGRATFGAMGALGRNVLGRAASNYADRLRTSGRDTGLVGRNLARFADYGAKASYNMRAMTPLKAALKTGGIDAGKPSSDAQKGFKGIRDASNKRANEDAKARKDAWAAQDGSFEKKKDELQRDQKSALAYAELAERQGKTGRAEKYRGIAEKRGKEIEENDKAYRAAKKQRLTQEDRLVRGYDIRKGTAAEAERRVAGTTFNEATKHLENIESKLSDASERLSDAAEKFSEAQSTAERKASVYAAAPTSDNKLELERAEASLDRARSDREIAEENVRAGRDVRAAASTAKATALKQQEATIKRTEADVKTMEASTGPKSKYNDPKYAMTQVIDSLNRLARTPVVNLTLDANRLRSAAASVAKEQGKSHTDHLLEELEHALAKGHHGHDDKADDHGKVKAPGKKDTHAPDPHAH